MNPSVRVNNLFYNKFLTHLVRLVFIKRLLTEV